MIDRSRTACFTGHREIPENNKKQLDTLLDKVIEDLYKKGVVFYGSGGAYGFDMLAESAVLRAKQRHSEIKLILVLPCRDHDKYWTKENKMQFAEILRKADKVVYTADSYFSGCMHKRNRHLVRYSGYCVAYSVKTGGGTAYTVDYAARNGLKIVNLAEFLQR